MNIIIDYGKGTRGAGEICVQGNLSTRSSLAERQKRGNTRQQGRWIRFLVLPLGVVLALGMLWTGAAQAQQNDRPDFGGGGIFSYVPPKGWKVADFPGLKFKISLGAPVKGFAPNIVVVDEAYEKSLDDYAKDNIATMQQMFPGMKLLGQTDFTTAGGARAIKLVTERTDESVKGKMRQVYYLYDAGNKKLAVTCSSLAEEGAASDAVCDGAMKTFTVKPDAH